MRRSGRTIKQSVQVTGGGTTTTGGGTTTTGGGTTTTGGGTTTTGGRTTTTGGGTTTTGGGAGSVILPPVMGTLTCIGVGFTNWAVENVALIVVGALVNALFGTNGAVPFVVPVNTNVVRTDPFVSL